MRYLSNTKKNVSWLSKLPPDTETLDETNIGLFFDMIFERQEIWYKRFILKQERPWTEDKFMANHKFTNVYRELDRSSQFLIRNVISQDLKRKDMIFKIILYRLFNVPETFNYLVRQPESTKWPFGIPGYDTYDKGLFKKLIYRYRAEGNNPFTIAYLTNSCACPGETRDWCFTEKVIPTLHATVPEILKACVTAKRPEEIIKVMMSLPSVSSFLAHEFYQDFCYIPKYNDFSLMKFNANDYTNVGPGASLGIRLIFPSLKANEQEQGIYWLRDLAEEELAKRGVFKYLIWDKKKGEYSWNTEHNITLHQIEMALCEFQKYWKMMIGEGKQRSVFEPITRT